MTMCGLARLLCCSFVTLAGSASVGLAQPLTFGRTIEGTLPERSLREFRLTLEREDYVEIDIVFGGVARARLVSSDGRAFGEAFSDYRGRVRHLLSVVAEQPGDYRLVLEAASPGASPAYRLQAKRRHAAPADHRRTHAARLVLDALELVHSGTQSEFERAAAMAQEALGIARALADPLVEERARRAAGHTNLALRKYAGALEHFEAAAALAGSAGDREAQAEAVFGVAAARLSSVGAPAALDDFERALALWRELGNALGLGATLDNIGVALHLSGDSAAAAARLDEALSYRRDAGDRIGEALTLHNRGMIAFYVGDARRAVALIQEALEVNGPAGDRRAVPHYTTSLARAYTALGEPQRAFDAFTSALELWRAAGDGWGEAMTLGHMGEALEQVGDSDRALTHFEAARDRYRAMGATALEARMLTRIGLIHERRGALTRALSLYTRALERFRTGPDPPHEAEALTAAGRVSVSLRRLSPAKQSLDAALAIRRAAQDRRGEGRILHELGRAEALAGRPAAAERLFQQSLALAESTGDREGSVETLVELSRLSKRAGDYLDALRRIERALEIDDAMRERVLGPTLRITYAARVKERHDEHVSLLYALHRRHPRSGYDRRALEAHERGRARAFVEALAEVHIDPYTRAAPELADRIRFVRARINALEDRQFRATSMSQDERARIQVEIRARLDEYERLQAQVRQTDAQLDFVTRSQAETVERIQQAIQPGERVLVYHLGSSLSILFAIGRDSFMSVAVDARGQLPSRVRRVATLLRDSRRQIVRSALELELRALARDLIQPARLGPSDRRLIIAPDGVLQYLPFAVLPADERRTVAAAEDLVARWELTYVPSASVIPLLRQTSRPWTVPERLAVIADPVFDPNDERIRTPQPPSPSDESHPIPGGEESLVERSAGKVNVALTRLRHTRREAERIASLAEERTTVALDFDANLQWAAGPALAGYTIVHFATHGFLHSASPALSGLVLSLVDEQGRPRDGFLRLHDVYDLHLRARLVVLSACETALGQEVRGEGLIGLARAFMYAGAPRVVVSLWNVSDEATAVLMEEFYRGLLVAGRTPSSALRIAQQKLRANPRWQAPYYWAGFILQGDWR